MAALFRVKALYEYSSPHEDDLNFPAGQIIAVTDDEDADWYGGEYVDESGAKKEGIFPRNFVEKFEPVAPPRPVRKQKQEPEAAAPAPPPPEASAPEDTTGRSTPPPAIPGGVASVPSPKRVAEPVKYTQPAEAPAPPVPAPVPVAAPAPPPMASPPAPAPAPLPTSPKRTESPASVASSAPKPKPAPPPVSEKPSSFKDRIAAFNKSAAPPIAPFKPSGLGSGSASGFVKKPFVAPPPSRNAYVPPVREAPAAKVYRREEDPEIRERVAETQGQAERAGLVPSESQKEGDEEDQPKPTSLKERIALLQKQQMEQAQRHADALAKKEKPKKPPPPKKRLDSQVSVPETEEAPPAPEQRDIDEPPVRTSMDGAPSENAPLALRPQPELTATERPVSRDTANEVKDDTAEADVDDRASHRLSKITTSSTTAGAAPTHELEQPATEPQEMVEEEAEQGEQEEQEEEEEEVDPEVRRKEELRARMAKMSGGMGFHGMFGPPLGGGLPPKKQGPKPPVRSATTREEDVTPPPHAPPVPTMIAIPGMMGLPVKPAEEPAPAEEPEAEQVQKSDEEEGDTTPPAPEHAEETPLEHRPAPPVPHEEFSAPPVPLAARPAPPPVPAAARSPPPPPSVPPPVTSATEGSESDDELSSGARENHEPAPQVMRSPPLPPHPIDTMSPQSPRLPSRDAFSPTSPTSKRASRPPPPVPGTAPVPPPAQSRPPPPPPPAVPSRRSTVDMGVASPTRPPQAGEDVEEGTEYEGDYDTDIASLVPHKDALAAHDRESSVDESSLQSPFNEAPPNAPPPPPVPFASTPRAAPPPVPQSPPLPRRSTEMSRSIPSLPPPVPPPKENHDALFIQNPRRSEEVAESPVLDEPTPLAFDDARAISPPDRRVPPPVGARPRASVEMSRPSLSAPRRSIDHHRPSMDSGFIAGDIDLAVQSGWWKQSNQVPPVLQGRKDIYFECDESTTTNQGEQTMITRETFILFQDYSQTILTVRYDPYDPSTVELEQRHEGPPKTMRQDQMEEAYDTFGRKISAAAIAKKDQVVGDGSAASFVLEMIRPLEDALWPISTRSYGALVYSNMANASTQQHDAIRPGDIITIRNAKFQGKHGPMHAKYSAEVGKPDHVGVVAEWDGTKKKVRAWEQGRDGKKVRQESYKLDDLRSGEVKIWRVVSRSWVGWQKKALA
ncbi:hypothetical protein M441DRAFT_68644 [Trichoderma asperellum CBS 433.97]|uniref:SH3 domain-containing protein n=2 Tax=Trichoderma asperellum TaxID=101201 RepID=A0A2T3ZA13_TRIA4|nr:hypothetical protein M441DRAFT_68644 [Trichoderma asperellum CBS 433.97]PTB41626.1 hypothetical protein M441DRAFT_68644 [Trichoderma asperellum CBS 433.97]